MEWWKEPNWVWGEARLHDEASQKKIDEQNSRTLPVVRVKVLPEYGDNRYVHFAVEKKEHYIVVLGGFTRLDEALEIAQGIHDAYQQGVEDERNRVRAVLGL